MAKLLITIILLIAIIILMIMMINDNIWYNSIKKKQTKLNSIHVKSNTKGYASLIGACSIVMCISMVTNYSESKVLSMDNDFKDRTIDTAIGEDSIENTLALGMYTNTNISLEKLIDNYINDNTYIIEVISSDENVMDKNGFVDMIMNNTFEYQETYNQRYVEPSAILTITTNENQQIVFQYYDLENDYLYNTNEQKLYKVIKL